MLYGIDDQKKTAILRELREAGEVETLTRHPADRAHQQGARSPVDRRPIVVHGEPAGTVRHESDLDAELTARVLGRQCDLRILQVGEYDVVAPPERDRVDRLMQPRRRVGDQADLVDVSSKKPCRLGACGVDATLESLDEAPPTSAARPGSEQATLGIDRGEGFCAGHTHAGGIEEHNVA